MIHWFFSTKFPSTGNINTSGQVADMAGVGKALRDIAARLERVTEAPEFLTFNVQTMGAARAEPTPTDVAEALVEPMPENPNLTARAKWLIDQERKRKENSLGAVGPDTSPETMQPVIVPPGEKDTTEPAQIGFGPNSPGGLFGQG